MDRIEIKKNNIYDHLIEIKKNIYGGRLKSIA